MVNKEIHGVKVSNPRIVSLAPSNTEILLRLGLLNQIAGCTAFCPKFKNSFGPLILGSWLSIDFEKLEFLQPDIIFTSTFLQESIVFELEKRKLPVLHLDVRSLNDVFQSINFIGKKVNLRDKAYEVMAGMKTELNDLKKLAQSFPRKNVLIEEWFDPCMASGNWVPEILEICNCNSILKAGEISRKVSLEEIEQFNPDCILLSWCGFKEKSDVSHVFARTDWQNLKAVQSKQVFAINEQNLNSPDPRLVLACKEIIQKVHGVEV
ncbi:MAG: ABC transporter substrate-binding protein [Candidatus Diapherotrites archaeon]|nr:ABC transporter substrate-binding protein [Candidatus Diapherotrites archaeon]